MGNRKAYHENEPAAQGQEEVRDSKHALPPSQKGPQAHAEGEHGEKTHSRFVEGREQHDEAEKNSERLRGKE